MPSFTLYYFPGRGVAESIRQMFHLADEEFKDVRIGHDEWPSKKADMPFGQMPVLEVDGVKLAQSAAIGRFVAKKFGFAGQTPIEAAQVDAIIDQYKDYYQEMKNWYYTALGFLKEGDKEELYKTVYLPARDKFFGFIQTILKQNGTGFLVGNAVTWADLHIADHVRTIAGMKPDAFKDFPEIIAHKEKIESIPQIKKWIDSRPESSF